MALSNKSLLDCLQKPGSSLTPAPLASGLFIVGFSFLSLLAPVFVGLLPQSSDTQVVVIAPPWYDRRATADLIASAAGDLVAFPGPRNIVVAHFRHRAFIAALYRAGAWLVLRPLSLAGCAEPQRGFVR